MSPPREEYVAVRGIRLHLLRWDGAATPFVLLHGLSSNARTWEAVGRILAEAGHAAVAVDQRGHGLSDKPVRGYGFDEVTADLAALIEALGFPERPILAGQSWGGNVVLDFAARHPTATRGIVLVDGGFLELSARPGATWERVSQELRPPPLAGTPRAELEARLRQWQPDWTDEGIEATLANMETLPDGTVRPWLTLDRHLEILRALWEHHPPALYPRVTVPTLIVPAASEGEGSAASKRDLVGEAEVAVPRARVVWFHDTAHDVHVHRPQALARVMLDALADGFFDP